MNKITWTNIVQLIYYNELAYHEILVAFITAFHSNDYIITRVSLST